MRQHHLQIKNKPFLIIAIFLILPFFVFSSLSLVGCESKTTGKKKQLSDLAVVKDKTVYPNGVDKTLLGAYEYDLKDPQQMVLAVVEGIDDAVIPTSGCVNLHCLPEDKRIHLQKLGKRMASIRADEMIPPQFAWRTHDDHTIRYIGGYDLAPLCRATKEVTTAEQARSVVRCLLKHHQVLWEVGGEAVAGDSWSVINFDKGYDMTFIEIQQQTAGLPVDDGSAIITIHDGRVIQFSGQLHPPSRLRPRPAAMSSTAVQALAKRELAGFAKPVRRYFLARTRSIISEFVGKKSPTEILLIDENSSTWRTVDRKQNARAFKWTRVGKFPPPYFGPPSTETDVQIEIELTTTATSCRGYLDSGGLAAWPRVIDAYDASDIGTLSPYSEQLDSVVFAWGSVCSYLFMLYDEHVSKPGSLMNLYFWVRDLAAFTEHWRAGYQSFRSWTHPKPITVIAADAPCAWAFSNEGEEDYLICLSQDPAKRLRTVSHEYGHVIAFLYGRRSATSSPLLKGVDEGFATANELRYILWRMHESVSRPFDPVEVSRDTIYVGDYRDVSVWQHGESLPTPDPDSAMAVNAFSWIYAPNSAACNESDGWGHACGRVLPIIYWELAWNLCGVDYRHGSSYGCSELQPILDQSVYTNYSEYLVNLAYTFALTSIDRQYGDVEDFFNAVSNFYNVYYNGGLINAQEYWRVINVLNHHCVGWSNHCQDYRHLPGSPLPRAFTRKQSFANNDSAHFILASDMTLEGASGTYTFPTADDAQAVWLGTPGGAVSIDVNFPESGVYTFEAVTAGWSEALLWLEIDGSSDLHWELPPGPSPWAWRTPQAPDTGLSVTAGTHTVRLIGDGLVAVEALLIKR